MESIPIEAGKVRQTGVITDDKGTIFIEFLKGDRASTSETNIKVYNGEILPPSLVSPPAKAPRARMREILSFEVISDTGDEVILIDQYAALNPHLRERLSYKDKYESQPERQSGAQLLTNIYKEDEIGRPILWRYDFKKSKWERLGGIVSESSEPDVEVFSMILYRTGTYTLWDENPNPTFAPNFPIDQVELAEESPYPSVEEIIPYDENGIEIPSVDEDFLYDTSFDENANPEGTGGENESDFNSSALIPPVNSNDPYSTEYGINDAVASEEEGFDLYDNFYDTFDTYLGEDEDGNPLYASQIKENGGTASPLPGSNQTLQEPPAPETIPENEDFKNSAALLQANAFGDTLAKTGGPFKSFNIPWLWILALLAIGGSVVLAMQKKYE